jgi:hypothetical protein
VENQWGTTDPGQPYPPRARLDLPIRDLADDDVAGFAMLAVTQWGNDEDFRHLLPRVLELLSADQLSVDSEMVLSKLAVASWDTWPSAEREAVARFLHARWDAGLAQYETLFQAGEWLGGILLAGMDSAAFVESWRRCESTTALAHLTDFMEDNSEALMLRSNFTDIHVPPDHAGAQALIIQMRDSLLDPRLETRMAAFALTDSREPWKGSAAQGVPNKAFVALQQLQTIRAAVGDS